MTQIKEELNDKELLKIYKKAMAECAQILGLTGPHTDYVDVPGALRNLKYDSDRTLALEEEFRDALMRISEFLKMTGSPHLIRDVPREVREMVRYQDFLEQTARRTSERCKKLEDQVNELQDLVIRHKHEKEQTDVQ